MDARIPVILATADQVRGDDALLCEGYHPQAAACFMPAARPGHPNGCLCCGPRHEAGRALAALFQDRARGRTPFFRRVVACTHTQAGRAEIEAALDGDPVASSCFRLIAGADC